MSKTCIIGVLLITVLLVLGACAPRPTPPAEEMPAEVPEDTSGHIYTDGAIECGGDREPIILVNNPNATNPTYAELVAFIIRDTTNTTPYIKGGPEAYICGDFAEEVHNNAEAAGIRVAWAGISFEGDDEGHACNAFDTTDKGLVYIDCTGELEKTWIGYILPNGEWSGSYLPELHLVTFESWLHGKSIPDSAKLTKWDTVAYIEVGKEYGLIGINEAKSLEYDFYLEYKQKWQDYEGMLEDYNKEVEQYNQEVTEYNLTPIPGPFTLSEDEANRWNSKMDEWFNRLKAWEEELDRQEKILVSLEEELGYHHYELPDRSGIVKDIHIHW